MRLGDKNFFNLFARLTAASNKDRDCGEWEFVGVRWQRRHHIEWTTVSYQLETHELRHTARPRWNLLFVHEIWWGADRRKAIRNAHWTHLESGNRRDVLKWFEERQRELD